MKVHSNKRGKNAWIIVNVGTPDAPVTKATRKYLKEFLNDPLVIDIPSIFRKLLVNFIIVPFRSPRSAKKYMKIWTPKGSPLLIHLNELIKKMNQQTDENIDVYGLMRYGNPSLAKFLEEISLLNYKTITIVPLYPHYAASTTGSVKRLLKEKITDKNPSWQVKLIEQFYDKKPFINTLAKRISKYQPEEFDHILFSYHGLPNRQVQKCHPKHPVEHCNCENAMPEYGRKCYRATCFDTTRILAGKLNLKTGTYSTAFQSRLSKNWMKPFTDAALTDLAKKGKMSVLVVPASFVADCLETTLEIKNEYKELFISAGGDRFEMTESLNSNMDWVEALVDIISAYQ